MKMKRFLFCSLLFILSSQARALDVSVLITQYFADHQPYIEIYLHTVASTVHPITSSPDSLTEKKVKVTLLFKQNENIVRYDNFIIESGKQKFVKDFVALKRYGLKPGKYKLDFSFSDLADAGNVYKDAVDIEVKEDPGRPFLSNLQLVADTMSSSDDQLAKNGLFYELIPYAYIKPELNRFGVYFESYNTSHLPGESTNFTFKISRREKDGLFTLVGRTNIKRKNTETDDVLAWFDATYYESGQYMVQLTMLGPDKKGLDSTFYYFTKSNPTRDEALLSKKFMDEVENSFAGKMTKDELNYALRAISMNVNNSDVELVNRLIKDENVIAKSNFIFKYFKEKSPVHPEEYYTQYMEVAKAVDKKYRSGLGYGFESDRGLIFMKYGKPSDIISINDDPSSAPYEIWMYYDIPKLMQSNVKFLFYNPFLDGTDYRLLQSNARGEMRNPNWKKELYKAVARNSQNLAPDNWEVPDGFNRQAEEWLQDL